MIQKKRPLIAKPDPLHQIAEVLMNLSAALPAWETSHAWAFTASHSRSLRSTLRRSQWFKSQCRIKIVLERFLQRNADEVRSSNWSAPSDNPANSSLAGLRIHLPGCRSGEFCLLCRARWILVGTSTRCAMAATLLESLTRLYFCQFCALQVSSFVRLSGVRTVENCWNQVQLVGRNLYLRGWKVRQLDALEDLYGLYTGVAAGYGLLVLLYAGSTLPLQLWPGCCICCMQGIVLCLDWDKAGYIWAKPNALPCPCGVILGYFRMLFVRLGACVRIGRWWKKLNTAPKGQSRITTSACSQQMCLGWLLWTFQNMLINYL